MIFPLNLSFLVIGLWLCMGGMPVQGQLFQDDIERAKSIDPPQYGLSLYPLSIFGSNLTLSLERQASFHTSLRAVASVGMAEKSNFYDVQDMTSGYFEVQGRYYPIGPALMGVYFGGFAYYKHMSFKFEDMAQTPVGSSTSTVPVNQDGTASGLGLGILVGYQYVLDKYIVGDIYLGAAMQSASIGGPASQYIARNPDHPLRNNVWDNYTRGLKAHIGVSIGFLIY